MLCLLIISFPSSGQLLSPCGLFGSPCEQCVSVCGHCLDPSHHFCGLFVSSRSLLDVLGLSLVDLLSHPSVVTSEKMSPEQIHIFKNQFRL